LTDDQRYDAAGFSDNDIIRTPALDKFASQAMHFINANVVFSLCSPSRAAILTGRYGSANGVLELNSRLRDDEKTIAEYLQHEGYATGISGKWHLPTAPNLHGFDFFSYFYANGTYYDRTIIDQGDTIHPEEHCDLFCVNRSVDFISEQQALRKPFFLFHCTQTPHMDHRLTWPARDETKSMYRVTEMPVPSNHIDDLKDKPKHLETVRNRTQAMKYGYPDSSAIQEHTRDY
jgi:arylsulfatase A-like enzyme